MRSKSTGLYVICDSFESSGPPDSKTVKTFKIGSLEQKLAIPMLVTGMPVPEQYHQKVSIMKCVPSNFQIDITNGMEKTHTIPTLLCGSKSEVYLQFYISQNFSNF